MGGPRSLPRRPRFLPCRHGAATAVHRCSQPLPLRSASERPTLPAVSAAVRHPCCRHGLYATCGEKRGRGHRHPPVTAAITIVCRIPANPAGYQCLPHAPRPAPVRAAGFQGAAVSGGLSGPRSLGRAPLA